jgi:hypothetical protein
VQISDRDRFRGVQVLRAYSSGDGSSPSPEQLREIQRRMGPPENELPGTIAFRAVVGRTDDFVVAIIGADAYRTGIAISIAIRLRHSDRSEFGLAHELFGRRHRGASGGELLVGVAYPDGRTATNVSAPFADPPTGLDHPTLTQGGGGGGGRSFSADYWLSPLPPPGDLTIVVAWPAHGIDETHTLMPADVIAHALAHNVELWPWEPPADHDDAPTREPPALPEGGWFAQHLGEGS